jgi:t-SNARE complex subunit (syntaxin)
MNRLLELQKASASDASAAAFSPTAADAAGGASAGPPSAAAAGDGDAFTNVASLPSTDDAPPTAITAGATTEYVVQTNEELTAALAIIEAITAGNKELQQLTTRLRTQTEENMRNFNPSDDKDSGAEAVDRIMQEAAGVTRMIKDKLEELDKSTKKLCENEVKMQDNAATVQIQKNQHSRLSRRFLEYVDEYQSAVGENERQLRETAVRRIKLKYTAADGTVKVSDEEARELASQVLELGRSDVLFQQSKECLNSVLETRQDILRIEKGMRELSQMMSDLQALILEQDPLLDMVVENVQNSVKFVVDGRKHLAGAREHAKAASSTTKYIVCCVSVLFLIILASVLGATIPT